MALMFQRLARNFAKNGYFPTDEKTTEGILSRLVFDVKKNKGKQGVVRMLDPCCGEGVALAECSEYLDTNFTSRANIKIETVGIEIDEERAYHAKSMSKLDTIVHGNLNDCYIAQRQFGLLFLNPPYGDILADKANLSEYSGRDRYEAMFYENTNKLLQFGGVLVFIVPNTCLSEKLSRMIASHFDQVTVYASSEQRFKQVVIFGIRCKSKPADKIVVTKLINAAQDITTLDTLTDQPNLDKESCFYRLPLSFGALKLNQIEIDAKQLSNEVANISGGNSLWDNFKTHFNSVNKNTYRPLRKMSEWHLSLALAAGQVSGVVESKDGRLLLVKGRTFKEKKETIETQVNEVSGNISEKRISTDVFVPSIKAIDFTKESVNFGEIITIK
ncbi:FIG023873: Plasmid related protein [uncultured Gammaproteobacteria bacterium]|jgi:tRNA1(Val) A37 N6-methylase TrmN6|nr:FIG023873: Plasmid related protein [uncultured Gammaproteobacteria bacterium]VVH64865.1 FIG023873: Plasmid related protein [uncultured Gammaproteobacteria bacterium]